MSPLLDSENLFPYTSQGGGSSLLRGRTVEELERHLNHAGGLISTSQRGLQKRSDHSCSGKPGPEPQQLPLPTWCRRFSRKLRRTRITSMFTPRNSKEPSWGSRVRRTSRHLRGKFPRRFTVWLGTDERGIW